MTPESIARELRNLIQSAPGCYMNDGDLENIEHRITKAIREAADSTTDCKGK